MVKTRESTEGVNKAPGHNISHQRVLGVVKNKKDGTIQITISGFFVLPSCPKLWVGQVQGEKESDSPTVSHKFFPRPGVQPPWDSTFLAPRGRATPGMQRSGEASFPFRPRRRLHSGGEPGFPRCLGVWGC